MTNFGASLRQARESKGISLDQIALETRISTRFLHAIENEEFHLLPGGIFNRGFIRAFAEKVGLNADQVVADYERLAQVRQPETPPELESAPAIKKDRHLYTLVVGALLLVIVIFYVVTRESGHIAQTASNPSPVATAQPSATPAPTTAPSPEATPSLEPPENATPPTEAAPQPATPAPAAQAPIQSALTLELEAHEPTWIKVVADGVTVNAGEVLEAGLTRKFTAENTLNISIGNAAGISLRLNDKPVKTLGKAGQVRELTITPGTIKKFLE